MKPNIIFASKRARIRQCGCGGQAAQLSAGAELLAERGEQAVNRCFLHETDQGFQVAKGERDFLSQGSGESQISGHSIADRGHKHSSPDFT
jgi:hypothetical protein